MAIRLAGAPLSAQDTLDLGATAMVASFLLGYEEDVEAACLRHTVQWALDGTSIGLPLIVEVRATGPRVSILHKAVELGVSYALEGGADVIVVPQPGEYLMVQGPRRQSMKVEAQLTAPPPGYGKVQRIDFR